MSPLGCYAFSLISLTRFFSLLRNQNILGSSVILETKKMMITQILIWKHFVFVFQVIIHKKGKLITKIAFFSRQLVTFTFSCFFLFKLGIVLTILTCSCFQLEHTPFIVMPNFWGSKMMIKESTSLFHKSTTLCFSLHFTIFQLTTCFFIWPIIQ